MSEQTAPAALRGRPKDPAKRQAILDAAKDLFLTHGFSGTSMDAVAAAAGVSKLTVYSHFSDKATLFSAAVEAKCENLMPFPRLNLEADSQVEAMLNEIGVAFVGMVNGEEAISLFRLMGSMATQDTEMSRLFFEAGPQRTLSGMERFLARAAQLQLLDVDDPAAAAEHFFGLLQGCQHIRVVIGCCEAPAEAEIRARVKKVVQVFLRAYSPRS